MIKQDSVAWCEQDWFDSPCNAYHNNISMILGFHLYINYNCCNCTQITIWNIYNYRNKIATKSLWKSKSQSTLHILNDSSQVIKNRIIMIRKLTKTTIIIWLAAWLGIGWRNKSIESHQRLSNMRAVCLIPIRVLGLMFIRVVCLIL